MKSTRWFTVARWLFGCAGAAFLLLAVSRTWIDARGQILPSFWSLAAAGTLSMIAVWCVALGWASLFEQRGSRRTLAYYFVVSQLGKYIPGGIWQFAGQIGFASREGATLARASSLLAVHLAVLAAAGGTIGALAGVLQVSVPGFWRAAALTGPMFIALLSRPLLLRVVGLARHAGLHLIGEGDIPSQRAIWRSFLWSVAALILSGLGFSLMLSSIDGPIPHFGSVGVFSLAWLVGFLAVPVPAGVGVREAVMLAFLPASAASIVAVSVCHRGLSIAAESIVMVVARTSKP